MSQKQFNIEDFQERVQALKEWMEKSEKVLEKYRKDLPNDPYQTTTNKHRS